MLGCSTGGKWHHGVHNGRLWIQLLSLLQIHLLQEKLFLVIIQMIWLDGGQRILHQWLGIHVQLILILRGQIYIWVYGHVVDRCLSLYLSRHRKSLAQRGGPHILATGLVLVSSIDVVCVGVVLLDTFL